MNLMILALPGAEELTERLAAELHCPASSLDVHRFPDGETVVRIRPPVTGRHVLLAAHLDDPDDKTLAMLFAADAARELGAAQVGLLAPYLPYMRQDERFHPGEAITSRSYARLLSSTIDFLVTVDPHLHRWPSLDSIYTIRSKVVAAAPAIAEWLKREVPDAMLVGPDSESEQWVSDVARRVGAPYVILSKDRHGDRDVRVHLPAGASHGGRTPVLLDDIVSSGHTLMAASHVLRGAGWGKPHCVAVHALVDAAGLEAMHRAGIARVASCDTVPHPTNAIGVAPLLADGVRALLAME